MKRFLRNWMALWLLIAALLTFVVGAAMLAHYLATLHPALGFLWALLAGAFVATGVLAVSYPDDWP